MKIIRFILLISFFLGNAAGAVEIEAIVAGSHHKVDGAPAEHGLSANLRFLLLDRKSSPYAQCNFPGINPSVFDCIMGFSFRSEGEGYVELGAGFRFSRIWGTGWALNAGFGYRLSDRWYVVLPVYYRLGYSVETVPYLGLRL